MCITSLDMQTNLHLVPHRQAGAWCMRCVGLALPSLLSTLIDYLLEGLRASRNNADALMGYSVALAAILATARHSELGVPTAKAEVHVQ